VNQGPLREPPFVPEELNEMVRIPAGKFIMGAEAPDFPKAMGPAHEVHTDEFLLAKYPVTNCQYKKYMDATGAAAPPHWVDGWYPEDREYHPVVNITWDEASAYAAWAGMRLPTEAEWEHAARGEDGRTYQWGKTWDPKKCHSGEDGDLVGGPVSVFEFSDVESPYGCVQLTGNVWEWCSDFVVKLPYDVSQNKNPRGLAGSLFHVARGGSWTTDEMGSRAAFRCISPIGARWGYEGLRCAKDSLKPGDLRPPGLEDMVLVPAGEFIYGSTSMSLNTLKQKAVYLDAYYIDKYCVTNGEYRRFVLATGYPAPTHWQNGRYEEGKDKCPVNNVSWEDASAFAKWAGKRLPTDAEWEKAARGTDGRLFPWGEEYDPTALNGREAKIGAPCPVDSFPNGISPYGCYQMSGNMWEWVADWYDPYYGDRMPDCNPKGPETGTLRTLRGGCWSSLPGNLTTTARARAVIGSRTTYSGFRCVKDAK
jgi:sulfatase modifying factor 1